MGMQPTHMYEVRLPAMLSAATCPRRYSAVWSCGSAALPGRFAITTLNSFVRGAF